MEMNAAQREDAAKRWDPRTPLERLDSLTQQEQDAFLGFFAGGHGNLQGFYFSRTGEVRQPSFGKAECEWVDFDFWRGKLPGLRLSQCEEGPRRAALGSSPGSAVWDITITMTDDGREAQREYWKRWREKADGG